MKKIMFLVLSVMLLFLVSCPNNPSDNTDYDETINIKVINNNNFPLDKQEIQVYKNGGGVSFGVDVSSLNDNEDIEVRYNNELLEVDFYVNGYNYYIVIYEKDTPNPTVEIKKVNKSVAPDEPEPDTPITPDDPVIPVIPEKKNGIFIEQGDTLDKTIDAYEREYVYNAIPYYQREYVDDVVVDECLYALEFKDWYGDVIRQFYNTEDKGLVIDFGTHAYYNKKGEPILIWDTECKTLRNKYKMIEKNADDIVRENYREMRESSRFCGDSFENSGWYVSYDKMMGENYNQLKIYEYTDELKRVLRTERVLDGRDLGECNEDIYHVSMSEWKENGNAIQYGVWLIHKDMTQNVINRPLANTYKQQVSNADTKYDSLDEYYVAHEKVYGKTKEEYIKGFYEPADIFNGEMLVNLPLNSTKVNYYDDGVDYSLRNHALWDWENGVKISK